MKAPNSIYMIKIMPAATLHCILHMSAPIIIRIFDNVTTKDHSGWFLLTPFP